MGPPPPSAPILLTPAPPWASRGSGGPPRWWSCLGTRWNVAVSHIWWMISLTSALICVWVPPMGCGTTGLACSCWLGGWSSSGSGGPAGAAPSGSDGPAKSGPRCWRCLPLGLVSSVSLSKTGDNRGLQSPPRVYSAFSLPPVSLVTEGGWGFPKAGDGGVATNSPSPCCCCPCSRVGPSFPLSSEEGPASPWAGPGVLPRARGVVGEAEGNRGGAAEPPIVGPPPPSARTPPTPPLCSVANASP